jgi:hypothetical protein
MLFHLELYLCRLHCSIQVPYEYKWHSSGCSEIVIGLMVSSLFNLATTFFIIKLMLRFITFLFVVVYNSMKALYCWVRGLCAPMNSKAMPAAP